MADEDFAKAADRHKADLVGAPFPTKEKLLNLIAEREKALSRIMPEHKPSWALDANDARRKQYRTLARASQRTETRLEKATQKLRHDFDWNS